MKLLAVIEDKNKRLRAYLPEFISPFIACMTRYCSVHDVPNFASTDKYICYNELITGSAENCDYVDVMKENVNIILLLETDIKFNAPDSSNGVNQPNVALNDDGCLVITVSIKNLFNLFGRKQITADETWDSFISSYTQDQLLQAVVQMPYPAIASSLSGVGTKGVTEGDVADPESDNGIHWKFPSGDSYLDFGLIYERPTAYTLDSIPGIEAHFGSIKIPSVIDEPAYGNSLTDIVVQKDVSCPITFSNCIPVVNGLMYIPTLKNGKMYIRSAAELFWDCRYEIASVMFLDFSEILKNERLTTVMLSDCQKISIKFDGKEYVLTVKFPEVYIPLLENGTLFTVIDGRLITFDNVGVRGRNVISIRLSDSLIMHMRERDIQLTDNVKFNEFTIKPVRSNIEWLNAQFFTGDDLKTVEGEESLNQHRSFFFFLPYKNIYINEYTVDDKLYHSGLITHGNVAGMLQGSKGLELFEHLILTYMDMRILKHSTGEKPDLVYGSDVHVLRYVPYNYLTTLENHIRDASRQSNIALESVPIVDRLAPEAIQHDSKRFKLLDIVKLK